MSQAFNILIASGARGDPYRYRTVHLFEQCCAVGLNATLSHVTDLNFIEKACRADLLVLHRAPWDKNIQRVIDCIHGHNGRIIFDTDDYIFDTDIFQWIDSPDFTDPIRTSLYKEDIERYRRTITLSDVLMTSTEFLARQAAIFKIPTFVHRNGFSPEMKLASDRTLDLLKKDSDNIVIGYASGTLTHNHDFQMIEHELKRILDENNNTALWLIGPLKLGREWMEYRKRIIQLPRVPWRLLPGYLSRFDVNLAPLVTDNPFAQSKSEIKWMEAALVRVPTIASATDSFNVAIDRGETGFLALKPDEWYRSLTDLIKGPSLRKRIGEQAYWHVTKNYNSRLRGEQFTGILEKVIPGGIGIINDQRQVRHSDTYRFSSHQSKIYESRIVEKSPSLFAVAIYSLRFRGISTLLKQLWVYFRRLISPIIPYRRTEDKKDSHE